MKPSYLDAVILLCQLPGFFTSQEICPNVPVVLNNLLLQQVKLKKNNYKA